MDSGHFRTAGGWVVELDLPLSKLMQEQADRKELVRVDQDDDGNWVDVQDDEPESAADAQDTPDARNSAGQAPGASSGAEGAPEVQREPAAPVVGDVPRPTRAGPGSSHTEWIKYALAVDPDLTQDEAGQMTRAALIERYGNE